MADKTKTPVRDARLKAALRDNLKRRKAASRKPIPETPKDREKS
jgi:hypothetical protein